MESPETTAKLRHRNSLKLIFGNFKHHVDNMIDDTRHIIIDVEDIEDDFRKCYNKCCLTCFLKRICCFLG